MALPELPADSELSLVTERMLLEPITAAHAEELYELFADVELHRFVPFEPLSLEAQRAECVKWAARRSPDGTELWLNWAVRHRVARELVGQVQAGVLDGGVASLGYLIARRYQRQGLAAEALDAVIALLRDRLAIGELKAWIDTRNLASIAVVQRLGLLPIERIEGADFFKGAPSDELVFSRKL